MTEKKIFPDATQVAEDNPYVDKGYIGNPEDLLKQIMPRRDLYYKALTLRLPYIYQSVAFFAGQQNTFWNFSTASLAAMPIADPLASTAINNRILNKCLAVIQRLTSFDPTSQCVPTSPSTADIYSARVAKKIVESNHNDPKLKYKQEYRKYAEYTVIMGMGFLRTEWDHYGGNQRVTYKTTPSFKEIQVEAQKEGESAFDELAEWLNDPMEEVNENDEETGKKSGEVPDEAAQDPGSGPDEGGDEAGTDSGDSDAVDGPNEPGSQEQDNQPATPQPRTFKIPDIDPITGKQKYDPVRDASGRIQIDKIEVDGVCRKKAISPLNILYNPAINDWSEAFDCFEEEYLSLDEVRRSYPGCDDLTEGDYETNSMNPWVGLLQIALGKNPMGASSGIRVTTYWCKSSFDFPEGLKVVYIKDKIRVAVPMPTLRGDCLPIESCGFIHMPGTFWYMSLPYYLMAPQTILNKLLRQQIDHARQFAVPKIIVRNDTTFANTITNGVEIIRASGNGPLPEFQQPQALSTAHMQLIKYMDDCIDTNSGVSKTAEGNPPPNVTSAEMSEAITENDYQLHMMVIDEFAQSITNSCNKEVRYIQENAADEILTRYVGPGGKWYTQKFKKANLRNLSDVMFIPGKAANMSRAQQRKDLNIVLPVVLQGQGNPDQQKKIIDKAIEFSLWGEEEAFESELQKQENCILDILAELEMNANNPNYDASKRIMPWNDLKVWLDVIQDQFLSYAEFSEKPPITQQRLIKLWQDVMVRLQKNMGQSTAQPPKPPVGPPQAQAVSPQAPGPAPKPMAPPQAGPMGQPGGPPNGQA